MRLMGRIIGMDAARFTLKGVHYNLVKKPIGVLR